MLKIKKFLGIVNTTETNSPILKENAESYEPFLFSFFIKKLGVNLYETPKITFNVSFQYIFFTIF